jgi:hypothetical protein
VFPAMSTNSKQLSNCPKIAEISVVQIIFNGVLCEVGAYTTVLPFLTVVLHNQVPVKLYLGH